jgi:hypothetical protein
MCFLVSISSPYLASSTRIQLDPRLVSGHHLLETEMGVNVDEQATPYPRFDPRALQGGHTSKKLGGKIGPNFIKCGGRSEDDFPPSDQAQWDNKVLNQDAKIPSFGFQELLLSFSSGENQFSTSRDECL